MLAGAAALDEVCRGDQPVPKRDFLDDIRIVAWTSEPLVDDVDEAEVIRTINAGVHEIGSIDVEDDVVIGAAFGAVVMHARTMAKGCHTVVDPGDR